MAKLEQHHYVTRAYLEGFSPVDGSHLYVYARNKANHFRAHPEKVAKIHNYYTVKREDGSLDNRIETLLQEVVEDPGLEVIRRLNAGHYDISTEGRAGLAFLMAIQEYRVPWMRENMEQAVKALQERYIAVMMDSPGYLEEQIAELTAANQNKHNLTADDLRASIRSGKIALASNPGSSLWAMGHLSDLLIDCYYVMKWMILEAASVPFITSDCPVHRFYRPVRQGLPYMGLADPRVQVRFPLSRDKMLVLRHDFKKIDQYDELHKKGLHNEAEEFRATASEITRVRVTDKDVHEINAHTISMAARMAFSSVEMPEVSNLFRGECQNLRQSVTALPGGYTQFSMVYPRRK